MLTLLKFEASWCKPCAAMKPILEKLDEQDELLIVKSVDIDDNPQLRAEYNIRSVPTLVLIENQREVDRKVGQFSVTELKEWVDGTRNL